MSKRLNAFRVWLVLIAALLVPLKGVLAASGKLCHTASAAVAIDVAHDLAMHEHDGAHAGHHDDGVVAASSDGSAGKAPLAPIVQTCAICAAFCSVPPLLRVANGIPLPMATSERPCPPIAAALAAQPPERLERPPRTV